MAKLHRAAHRDETLAIAFHRVANLLAPPPSVMRPANLFRVLRGNLRNAAGNVGLERYSAPEVRRRADAAVSRSGGAR